MVDKGQYFCINRGRKYGKTTTLNALKGALANDYEIYSLSFEGLDIASYETDTSLAYAMLELFSIYARRKDCQVSEQVQTIVKGAINDYKNARSINLTELSMLIADMCEAALSPLVLIIDEVDQASNYDSFIRMLGLLRKMYLERESIPTLQSVILAGVYDIKNLKLKIRPEAEHAYNSPWNIAADFDVDMSFNVKDVESMLNDYENEP